MFLADPNRAEYDFNPGAHIDDEQCGFLSEIAFASVECELGIESEPIFKLLIAVFPDNASGYVGAAFSCMQQAEEERALSYVSGDALSASINVEMAWGVRLYLARRYPQWVDPDEVMTEMEFSLSDELLTPAVGLADELAGTIDDGGTRDPDFSRLPNWIWRKL